jgi:hypothetical protein
MAGIALHLPGVFLDSVQDADSCEHVKVLRSATVFDGRNVAVGTTVRTPIKQVDRELGVLAGFTSGLVDCLH